jgi:hypothetical protein
MNLIIVLAFVIGFMLQGMMKNMCGERLIEGGLTDGWDWDSSCDSTGQIRSGLQFSAKNPDGKCVDKLSCSKKIPAIGCVKDKAGINQWNLPKSAADGSDIQTLYTHGTYRNQHDPGSDKIARSTDGVVSTGSATCWCPEDSGNISSGACRTGLAGPVVADGVAVTDDYRCVCKQPQSDGWDSDAKYPCA